MKVLWEIDELGNYAHVGGDVYVRVYADGWWELTDDSVAPEWATIASGRALSADEAFVAVLEEAARYVGNVAKK